jgi:hypothetical protein
MRRWLRVLWVWLVCANGLLASAHSIDWNATAPGAAQKKAETPRFDPFVGTLEDARKEAVARNVPLVICAVLAEEEASQRFANTVPNDPAIAAVLQRTVLLVANPGEHPTKKLEETVDGKPRARDVCSVFFTPTCADHQKLFDPVYLAYNENGDLRCPQVILVAPDGKVARRIAPGDVPKATDLADAVAVLVKKIGPGLTREELATVIAALANARKCADGGEEAEAWRACASVLAIAAETKYGEEARAGQARALEALASKRDGALAALAGPTPLDGWEALTALAAKCKGLPNEKELAKLIEKAESAPATRDVIAARKKSLAADTIWQEIGELQAKNQKKKAEAKIRLLIRKYWDTDAGKRARKTYPEIAADEDKKGG